MSTKNYSAVFIFSANTTQGSGISSPVEILLSEKQCFKRLIYSSLDFGIKEQPKSPTRINRCQNGFDYEWGATPSLFSSSLTNSNPSGL